MMKLIVLFGNAKDKKWVQKTKYGTNKINVCFAAGATSMHGDDSRWRMRFGNNC